jgi:pyruvate kinase
MLVATFPIFTRHERMVCEHPLIGGIRLNTARASAHNPDDILDRLLDACSRVPGKPIWIDLKGRQLRVTRWADPFYEDVEINHRIKVNTPALAILRGDLPASIVGVNGNRIRLDARPRQALGAGQAIYIADPSLEIEGYLTDTDRGYVAAAVKRNMHRFMLSFVERTSDIGELTALDPEALPLAKIESPRGLTFVREEYEALRGHVRLMLARDDLYVTLGPKKFDAVAAEREIIACDPKAFAASRILESLEEHDEPSLGDLKDLLSLIESGYERLVLGDGSAITLDSFLRTMDVYRQFLEFTASVRGKEETHSFQ